MILIWTHEKTTEWNEAFHCPSLEPGLGSRANKTGFTLWLRRLNMMPRPLICQWDLSCLHVQWMFWFGEYLQCSKSLQSILYTNYCNSINTSPCISFSSFHQGGGWGAPSMSRILMRSLHRLGAQSLHSLHHTEKCVWESCIFLCSSSYCVPIILSTRVLESIYSPWSSLVYLTVSHMLSGIIRGLEGCWAILPFKRPPTTEKERPLAAHSWTVPCSQHLVLHKLWVAAFNVLWELGLNWVTNIQEVKGSHHTLDMMY